LPGTVGRQRLLWNKEYKKRSEVDASLVSRTGNGSVYSEQYRQAQLVGKRILIRL